MDEACPFCGHEAQRVAMPRQSSLPAPEVTIKRDLAAVGLSVVSPARVAKDVDPLQESREFLMEALGAAIHSRALRDVTRDLAIQLLGHLEARKYMRRTSCKGSAAEA
jgi:hypothetical protein